MPMALQRTLRQADRLADQPVMQASRERVAKRGFIDRAIGQRGKSLVPSFDVRLANYVLERGGQQQGNSAHLTSAAQSFRRNA